MVQISGKFCMQFTTAIWAVYCPQETTTTLMTGTTGIFCDGLCAQKI